MRLQRWLMTGVLALACGPALAGYETPPPGAATGAGPSPWSVVMRFFAGYNDNVPFTAASPSYTGYTGANQASPFAGASLNVSYRHDIAPGLVAGAALRADLNYNFSNTGTMDTPRDYSLWVFQPTLFVIKKLKTAHGTDVTLQGSYSFRRDDSFAVHGVGGRSHNFSASAEFDVPGPWSYSVALSHAINDFDVVYTTPGADRDGAFTELSFGARYVVGGPFIRAVSGRTGLRHNAAGADWSYTGWFISGTVEANLHGPFAADFTASHASQGYVGDLTSLGASPGRTSQSVTNLTGRILWHIDTNKTADFSISHDIVGSNSAEFRTNRTSVMAGITLRLK